MIIEGETLDGVVGLAPTDALDGDGPAGDDENGDGADGDGAPANAEVVNADIAGVAIASGAGLSDGEATGGADIAGVGLGLPVVCVRTAVSGVSSCDPRRSASGATGLPSFTGGRCSESTCSACEPVFPSGLWPFAAARNRFASPGVKL